LKRVLGLGILLAVVGSAHATPEIWEAYRTHYAIKPDSDAGKAMCSNCHTSPPEHNAFGKRLKAAMQEKHSKTLTPEILASLEGDDSDGDGWTNGDEAKAGFNPGDPKSHASGTPPKKDATTAAAPAASGDSVLFPKHSFHPVLVHFPIALFIFGAFLELWGFYKRDAALRGAGYWNLLFGSIATSVAIATGFIGALRQGFDLAVGGPVFLHLALAILASLLMLGTVLWRKGKALESTGYWALLVLAAIAVGVAGHFGGNLVY